MTTNWPRAPRYRYALPVTVKTKTALGFVALMFVSAFACWPGLSGSWVGDDIAMPNNPNYDDAADIAAVVVRHSRDYTAPGTDSQQGIEYRPTTMFTLVATHVIKSQPWAHHLVGWLLHFLVVWLVWRGLLFFADRERSADDKIGGEYVALFLLTALFALHPVGVEAYVWINGRSDLVAGVFLALLFWWLQRDQQGAVRAIGCIAICALGGGSKVTFLPAAAAVIVGTSLRRRQSFRGFFADGAASSFGVLIYLVARQSIAPIRGDFAQGSSLFTDAGLWAGLPKLLAMSAESVLTLRGDAMRSLAWQLIVPLSAGETVCLTLSAMLPLYLLLRRDLGGFVYLLGTAVTVAPTIIVSRAIWLGFDRYLYMPMILVVFCVAPYVVKIVQQKASVRVAAGAVGMFALMFAAATTYVASQAYRNHATYLTAMIEDHGDDPTLRYFLANDAWHGNRFDVASNILQSSRPPWPKALIVPQMLLAQRLKNQMAYAETLTYGSEHFSEDPLIRAYAMRWHYEAGRFEKAIDLAMRFRSDDSVCAEVKRQLQYWQKKQPNPERSARLGEVARALTCPAK